MPTRDERPRIEHRSPSEVAFAARGTEYGLAFFGHPADPAFISMADVLSNYASPESWFAHQLLKRCGYSGMLRGG